MTLQRLLSVHWWSFTNHRVLSRILVKAELRQGFSSDWGGKCFHVNGPLCQHPIQFPRCMWLKMLWGFPGSTKVHFVPSNEKSVIALIFIAADKVLKNTHKSHGFKRCAFLHFWPQPESGSGSETGLESCRVDPDSSATRDLYLLNVKGASHLLAHRRVQ